MRCIPVALFILAVLAPFARAQEPLPDRGSEPPDRRESPEVLSEKVREAVRRGLAYLADNQDPERGAWNGYYGYKLNYDYKKTGKGPHVAITALASLAFLSSGAFPKRSRYSAGQFKAVDFLLRSADLENGPPITERSRLYHQAFSGLFLAEWQTIRPNEKIAKALHATAAMVRAGQDPRGGWGYLPFHSDPDITVTVPLIHFLKAAKRAGVDVPQDCIDRGVGFVKSCRNGVKSRSKWPKGTYSYQPREFDLYSRTSFATTVAGLSVESRRFADLNSGLWFCMRKYDKWPRQCDFGFFFGFYFAKQVVHHLEDPIEEIGAFDQRLQAHLLSIQQPDGSWYDDIGPAYATAMAVLILTTPLRNLSYLHTHPESRKAEPPPEKGD